jgi:hypothetical protein
VVIVDSDGVVELNEVTYGVGEGKTMIFDEISLVEPIFELFLFPGSAEDCDVAAHLISRCWDVLVSVWVPIVGRETERVGIGFVCAEMAVDASS